MHLKPLVFSSLLSISGLNLVHAKEESATNTNDDTPPVFLNESNNKDSQEKSGLNEASKARGLNDVEESIDRINENVRLAVNLSALDMPFPLSAGLSVIYQKHPKWMIEFNYLRNMFDLNVLDVETQELGQQHFSVKGHYFVREHYYVTAGIGKRYTKARMSDDFFNYSNYTIESTYSKFNTDYLTVGVGSVFKLKNNIQLNLDWAAFNFAFSKETSQSAASFANGLANQQKVAQYEQTLEEYMSNSFLRLTVLGQY